MLPRQESKEPRPYPHLLDLRAGFVGGLVGFSVVVLAFELIVSNESIEAGLPARYSIVSYLGLLLLGTAAFALPWVAFREPSMAHVVRRVAFRIAGFGLVLLAFAWWVGSYTGR